VISNPVLESIDYLMHMSYLKVLEQETLSTQQHSIQQVFAKNYAVLCLMGKWIVYLASFAVCLEVCCRASSVEASS
jgi:hypothetical protein